MLPRTQSCKWAKDASKWAAVVGQFSRTMGKAQEWYFAGGQARAGDRRHGGEEE